MLEVIKKRRSIRKYQEKEIEEEKLKEVLKAAMFAPSAMDRRPWDFVVVRDKKVKEQLAASCPWAAFAKESAAVVVVVGDEKRSRLWIEDCSLAAGLIYLEATNQGLGACWAQVRSVPARRGDAEDFVRNLLKIPGEKRVLCLMALGYPAEEKKEHTDDEFKAAKVHYETW